jgi:polyphosphate kinase 2 (PPK2 family)
LAVKKFTQYGAARDEMLRRTDTPYAPWTVINSNVKKWARLESMRHVLHELPYTNKDLTVVHEPEPLVVRRASELRL